MKQRILILNPSHRPKKRLSLGSGSKISSAKGERMARRRASAAQLRARARFVKMVRSGSFKRRRRAKRNPRGIWDTGIHRPRLRISRGRKTETLRPRSPYRSITGKPLITKINKRRRRRSNQGAPAMLSNRRRRRRARARRRNPVLFNRSRRHRMRRRRNPAFNVRAILNRQFIMNAILAGGGFAIGIKASSMVAKIPGVGALGRFKGVVHILLGSVVAVYAKQAQVRALAGGFAAAGAYDLLAQNIPQLALPSAMGVDIMGDEGIDAGGDWDEGQQNGVDFQHGDDGNAELLGASGSSYNSAY